MARKITFEVASDDTVQIEPEPKAPALSGMARSLHAAAASSVRDLDVSLIEDSPLKDRLSIDPHEIADLAASIKQHGQLVPILVSPLRFGRYRIVYGRRRLLALRQLGLAAKALVRDLTDDEAIVAQGQENTARKDLSWIEKASFAGQLLADGKSDELICDALNIDQKSRSEGGKLTNLSRIKQVLQRVSPELIRAIGAAPSYGRDRWYSFAQNLESAGFPLGNQQRFVAAVNAAEGPSDARFAAALAALQEKPEIKPVVEPASVRATPLRATITIHATAAKDLHAWVRKNPEAAIQALIDAHQNAST